MSLAVPTSRASILRPLNESIDFDENPDTPGTTYSFQDQSSKPMNMQAETVPHLAAAMVDASMLISTDDEMLDSDSDQRRDEDYDIDIDAEVYSVNSGDLEATMIMEEDIAAYGHLEQDDNDDDIMLDDDPTDYGDSYTVNHGGHNITATQVDTQPDVSSSIAPALSHQESSFFQQLSPHQSNFDRQDLHTSSQPVTTQSDVGSTITELQTEQTGDGDNGGGEPVGVDQQQEQAQEPQQQPSPVFHQDTPFRADSLLEEEENDGTQSSTATLAHEVVRNDGHTAGEENDNTPVPKHEFQEIESSDADTGPVGGEDPFASLYQHPVIVQYEQNQLTLFPSMADWSNDPVLANVYSDLPSDYLLPDVGVCEKPLSELFMHLRDVLGPAVGLGSKLIVEIVLLGLKMGEDNAACKSVSLRRILDLHNQLHENDGYDIPMPVTMSLYTVPRFLSRLQEIANAVQDKKGLQECLGLLGLPSVDDYSNEEEDVASYHEADAAGYSEKQNGSHSPQNPTIGTGEDSSQSPTLRQPEGEAEIVESHEDAIVTNPETEHPNVGPGAETQGSAQQESDASHTHVIIQQTTPGVPSHSGSTVVDEEELLEEFEDGQGTTEQSDTVLQPDHTDKLQKYEHVAQDEAEELLGAVDDAQSLRESDVPVQPTGAEPEVIEEEHAPSTVANSDEYGTPPNLNDNSNKPSPIPVFDGDEDDEGEYDEPEQPFEEYGYEQPAQEQQGTESIDEEQTRDDEEEEIHDVDPEGYDDEHFQGGIVVAEERSYVKSVPREEDEEGEEEDVEYDAPGDYYDEGQGEYNQQDKSVHIQTEEVKEYEVEEYDDSPYESPGNQSPRDEIEVIDPSITDAIDITTICSPAASTTEEEELIDYEDNEEPVLLPQSPTSLKRVRDNSDAEGDDEVDADQAVKRARAE